MWWPEEGPAFVSFRSRMDHRVTAGRWRVSHWGKESGACVGGLCELGGSS